jgi:hypothetical protein
MSTTSDRLDRLEAENVALRAEVDRLRAKVDPPPPPPPDYRYGGKPVVARHATVTTYADPPPPPVSEKDLRDLRRIVGLAHPGLISKPDGTSEDEALARFTNAFHAVAKLYRTPELDTKRTVAWWLDYARSVAGPDAGQADFGRNDLMAAALAHGVAYRAWGADMVPEFALAPYRLMGETMHPMGDHWRMVLRQGQVLPPSKPLRGPVDPKTGRYLTDQRR